MEKKTLAEESASSVILKMLFLYLFDVSPFSCILVH